VWYCAPSERSLSRRGFIKTHRDHDYLGETVGAYAAEDPTGGEVHRLRLSDTAAATEAIVKYVPLSTPEWAVVVIIIAYFGMYSLLACVHNYSEVQGMHSGIIETVLESAVSTVCLAPMMCALFFALYKRADVLTAGRPRDYRLPPAYVRVGIAVSTTAFCAQMVLYIIKEWLVLYEVAYNESGVLAPGTIEVVQCWTNLFNFAMVVLYVSLTVVLVGLISMTLPQAARLQKSADGISDGFSSGTLCTVFLLILYFLLYLLLLLVKIKLGRAGMVAGALNRQQGAAGEHLLSRRSNDARQRDAGDDALPETLDESVKLLLLAAEFLQLAATNMNFAPMLCTLFISMQMCADRGGKRLPDYVETCMYLCSGMILLQVLLIFGWPIISGPQIKIFAGKIEVEHVTRNHAWFLLLSAFRWMAVLTLYVGIAMLCVFLWGLHDKPLWLYLLCHLATYFFVVYLLLWTAITLKSLSGGGFSRIIRTLTAAKDTVAFCPMVAVLFLASWVRAGHLINSEGLPGVPQGHAQDHMYVATYALLAEILLVLINGPFSLSSKDAQKQSSLVELNLRVVMVLFCSAVLVVYISIIVVIVYLLTISPQTAISKGAWLI